MKAPLVPEPSSLDTTDIAPDIPSVLSPEAAAELSADVADVEAAELSSLVEPLEQPAKEAATHHAAILNAINFFMIKFSFLIHTDL